MRYVGILAVIGFLLAAAGTARATNDYGTVSIYEIGTSPSAVVNISGTSGYSGGAYAGVYNLSATGWNVNAAGQQVIGTPAAGPIPSFCIDVHDFSGAGYNPYDIDKLENAPIYHDGGAPMGASRATDLRLLFGAEYLHVMSAVVNGSYNGYTGTEMAVAFQAAVWEIVNESSLGFNVKTGNEQISSTDTIMNLANGWLSDLATDTVQDGSVVALVNSTIQDYAITEGSGGSGVPEPVTMCGLLLGIGGLVRYTRRRTA